MVANLRQGGHQLVVHDRSITAMEAVCKDGAETASSRHGLTRRYTCGVDFKTAVVISQPVRLNDPGYMQAWMSSSPCCRQRSMFEKCIADRKAS